MSNTAAAATRLPVVGVMGSGTEAHEDLAAPLGVAIARAGWHLLTGGGRGVMTAASRAFCETPGRAGLCIGVVPAAMSSAAPAGPAESAAGPADRLEATGDAGASGAVRGPPPVAVGGASQAGASTREPREALAASPVRPRADLPAHDAPCRGTDEARSEKAPVAAAGDSPPGYPNPWVELAVRTHLPFSGASGTGPDSRNHINVLSTDAVVALPGSAGTRSEIELALGYGRPLVLFDHSHADSAQCIAARAAGVPVLVELDEVLAWLHATLGSCRRQGL